MDIKIIAGSTKFKDDKWEYIYHPELAYIVGYFTHYTRQQRKEFKISSPGYKVTLVKQINFFRNIRVLIHELTHFLNALTFDSFKIDNWIDKYHLFL